MLSLNRESLLSLPLNLRTDKPETLAAAFHIPTNIAALLIEKQWAAQWYLDYTEFAEATLKLHNITRTLEAQSDVIVNTILLTSFSKSINDLYPYCTFVSLGAYLGTSGFYLKDPFPTNPSAKDDEAFPKEPRSTPLQDKMTEYGLREDEYH